MKTAASKKVKVEKRKELQRMLNDMLGSMKFLVEGMEPGTAGELRRRLALTPSAQHMMLKRLLDDRLKFAKFLVEK